MTFGTAKPARAKYNSSMDMVLHTPGSPAASLLARLRAFCFPAGEPIAEAIRVVKTTETGLLRISPRPPWTAFAVEQEIDSTQTRFPWNAWLHPGKLTSVMVTDAYEGGHGRLTVKRGGGLIPVKTWLGWTPTRPNYKRYLASLVLSPTNSVEPRFARVSGHCAI